MTPHHDETAHRFSIRLPEGEAFLDYERSADGVDFTHTFVPPELRGRGLAEALVRAGLAWAEGQKLRIAASCSYVAKYRQRQKMG